jgi:ADP-ribose pyrophosphatase
MSKPTDPEDKPNAASLGCRRLGTDYPFQSPLFRIRRDLVRWPNGTEKPYYYIQPHGAVWIVPVTPQGNVVLIRQFRYTIDEWCWEVPAGGFHDFEGTPLELAKKELLEEVGGTSERWTYINRFRPGVSTIDELCHVYLARDVRLGSAADRDDEEIIEIHQVAPARALEMARSGEMEDGRSALALLLCEPHLKEEQDG